MNDSKNTEITIACYLESEWDDWRALVEDGEATFQGSYKIWKGIADHTAAEKRAEGFVVKLVEIRLADFLAWAKRTNRKTDSSARAAYAGLIAEAQ